MDSDSEDDDIFVCSGLNKRQEKKDEKARAKQRSILDDALNDSELMCASAYRVSAMKKQNGERSNEELRARAENLTQRFNTEKMEKESAAEDVDGLDLSLQDHLLSMEQRSKLAQAVDTDQSTEWGLRSIVNFKLERCKQLQFYSSESEAIKALSKILGCSNNKENHSKCTSLENSLTACIDQDVLGFFLHAESAISRALKKDDISVIDADLMYWLKRTAQSAGLIQSQSFLEGVNGNLKTLIRDGFCPWQLRMAPISQFAAELRAWVDLSCMQQENEDSMDVDNSAFGKNNLPGLIYLIRFWKALLSNGWDPPTWDPKAAADILVTLCLIGIDYATASSQTTRAIRGELHQIIPVFLDRISSLAGNEIQTWMDDCVDLILDKLANFGPGKKGSDDEKDTQGWICHAILLQSIPMFVPNDRCPASSHMLSNQFRIKFAVGALDTLSDGKVKNEGPNKDSMKEQLGELCSEAFSAAVGALHFINSLGDYVLEVAPLCPAILECATAAFLSGSILLRLKNESKKDYTKEQAKMVAMVLGHLKEQTVRIKKLMRGMITNPHVRRAEYHASILYQYYNAFLPRAKKDSGESGEIVTQQTTINFKSKA